MSLDNRGSLEPWIRDEVQYYPHQVEGIGWMKNQRSVLLADDMGLGKSVQALTVFAMMLWRWRKDYGEGKSGRMLVVAPVNLKENWGNEIEKFSRISHVILEGTPAKRRKLLIEFANLEDPKILIINYEQVQPHVSDLNDMRFNMIVADEAHYLKNPRTKRTKAFRQLRAERKFMLTGSPVLNNVHELWVILDQISPGQWGTYWNFRQEYCVFGGWGGKEIVGVKNEQRLRRRLNQVMIRRLKKDVLDLPDVQYIERLVHLHPEQKKMYNKIVEDEELDRGGGDDPETIQNALTRFLRLKQICGTTAAVREDGKDFSSKLDLAEEDAEIITDGGNKIVVFTQFRSVIEAYRERLEKRLGEEVPVYCIHGDVPKGERPGIIAEWETRPGAAILIGTTKVMGVGLNLTAARYGQFIDKEFTPMLNQQAVDRMNRIGASETQSIQIFEYRAKGTAEFRVEAILKEKRTINENIIENKEDADFNRRLMQAIEGRAE